MQAPKHWKKLTLVSITALVLIGSMQESVGRYHGSERGESGEGGNAAYLRANNATWQAECSACHMAYPPSMLPASSWKAMMSDLPNHFGTDASLDEATIQEIMPLLEGFAAKEPNPAPEKPVLRITETRWFIRQHDEISDRTWNNPKVKSASNCMACHTQADKGNFDEDNVRIPR